MRSDEVADRLRELLRAAGVDLERPTAADVWRTWDVIAALAAEPAEDVDVSDPDNDMLLAQYGTYDWGEGEHYELDMTRQFVFYDAGGEYAGMAQLVCTYQFVATPSLRELGAGNLWSGDARTGDFLAEALALRGFADARELQPEPVKLIIDYSDV